MHALKCPKCGREVVPQRSKNGYIAECCDWFYFQPADGMEAAIRDEDSDDVE